MAAASIGIVVGEPLFANGYKVLGVRSAKATGMGEAFVAQADDPSALAFNPAGLPQLEGTQINGHGTVVGAYTKRTTPSGQTERMEEQWQTVPSMFVTTEVGIKGVVVGVGASMPNGLSSKWDRDSGVRYVATYSDLQVSDIGPSLGVRVSERLLLGFGLDFYWSEARLERMVDLGLAAGLPGMMDGESRMKGSGTAWGFNAGLLYRFNPVHAAALTYRHPYRVRYGGNYSLPAAGIESDATASIEFPPSVVAGYAFRPSERWTIEGDLDWTGWRSVGDIAIDFDAAFLPDSALEQDLKNTLAYKVGAQYAWSQTLRLRAGYIYNENATRERTWRPSLPDTVMHFLTAGVGCDIGGLTLDAALQLVFYEKRRIDNNVDNNERASSSSVDGEYETFAPCLSVGATYRF